jgi:hypothetical protein
VREDGEVRRVDTVANLTVTLPQFHSRLVREVYAIRRTSFCLRIVISAAKENEKRTHAGLSRGGKSTLHAAVM